MHSAAAVVALSSVLAFVSGTPLVARGNTCGGVPAGSNSALQPLLQPSGIQTAAACKVKCDAESGCLSFVFGFVDNKIQCKLYNVAAASVPKQTSNDFIVYDKACDSVPAVVPTSSNPTGKAVNGQGQAQGQAQGQTQAQGQQSNPKQARNTCGSKPTASNNNGPISSPTAANEAACKALCKANTSCKSFIFGNVNNSPVCRLYAVPAASVPAPTNAAEKNAVVAYDIGC